MRHLEVHVHNFRRFVRVPAIATAVSITFAVCDHATPPGPEQPPPPPPPGATAIIVAAGDIGRCTNQFTNDDSTAKLVRGVPDATVLTLGDHAFPRSAPAATSADYADCYGPNWGQPDIKSRTLPAAG